MNYRLLVLSSIIYLVAACSTKKKYTNFVKIEKEKLIKEVVVSNNVKLPEEDVSAEPVVSNVFKTSIYDALPKSFNLKPFLTEAKSQDFRNTCGYFAFCGLLEAAYAKKYKKNINLSEEYLIALHQGNFYGANETCAINSVIATYSNYGIVPESSYPYQPKWSEYGFPYHYYRNKDSIPAKAYLTNKPDKIHKTSNYYHNSISATRGLTKILKTLVNDSLPLISVFIFTKDRYDHFDSENGSFKKTTFSEIKNLNEKTGEIKFEIPKLYKVIANDTTFQNYIEENQWENHFMLITGYDKDLERIYFKNSWGKSFGDDGYGFISFSEFKKRERYSYHLTPEFILNVFEEASPKAIENNIEGEEIQTNYTKEGALEILFTGKIETIPYKSLLIEHKIYELEATDKGLENDFTKAKVFTLNVDNSKMVEDKYIRTYWNSLSDRTKDQYIWTNENPLKSRLSKQKMKTFLNQYNPSNRYFVCSTITTYDDVNNTVELRRIWTPLEIK
jgi:Papain family cysteine protease